jgi:hypothetical protein
MEIRLYRGIAVERSNLEATIDSIANTGISGEEGKQWRFEIPDISQVRQICNLDPASFQRLVNTIDDSSGERILEMIFGNTPFRGVCACGDELGGRYYALAHNRTRSRTESLLIIFTANVNDVYVDPRDFLCTAFQLWDRDTKSAEYRQRAVLRELYGPQILKYFDIARLSSSQRFRIAMCNLASFDAQVCLGHYNNEKVIKGRHRTTFCSAFIVKCPIKPSQILECIHLEDEVWREPNIDVQLTDFLSGEI